jgi:hypothetical protein
LGLVTVTVAAVASACGGGGKSPSGLVGAPAPAIIAAAKAAGTAARSVKVTATADVGGTQEAYVLLLEQDSSSYEERAAVGAQRFILLRIGEDVYVIGNPAFLAAQGASPARQTELNDQWLKGVAGQDIGPPTLAQVMDTLLNPQGPTTKGGTSTVDRQPVVAVLDPKVGGTLYVSTKGTPYPVELTKHSSSITSTLTFGDWNQPLDLTAPASYRSLALLSGRG